MKYAQLDSWQIAYSALREALPLTVNTRAMGYYAKTVDHGYLTIEQAVAAILADTL